MAMLASTALTACASKAPPMTQLQIREYQTRHYDVEDIKMAMKAVLNVLQDDGYNVRQANVELGFLNAVKETQVQGTGFARFMLGAEGTYDTNLVIECTANVSIFNKQTRVRANFVKRVLNNKGGVTDTRQIEDQRFYQDFFAKVDKGMFLEKEKL